ncbi:hypothetical protein WA026_006256 [Henosepilachna vigintioctopunctata]|uniref:Malate dehydrogenase, mitochondrial n=1 Tax=Henosepilachna vigintioctopunctata TaxID=420089 RepID=A0AAW1TQW0_9CUCU
MNISKFGCATKIFKTCILNHRTCSLCPPVAPYRYTVTLMDSTTVMGQALALLLKQNPLIRELRLYDDKDCTGLAVDLNDIDTYAKVVTYNGEERLNEALIGTDIAINCGGHSQNPFESYEDLFEKNVDHIRRSAIYLTEFNQKALYVIARPPIESLVSMVYQEYRKAKVKSPHLKIFGVANYTMMRANHWISKVMKVDAFNVTCPIIGGTSADVAVAVLSGSNPGRQISDPRKIAIIQEGMAFGEEKILSIKVNEDGGCVALSPAVATYRLVNNMLRGLRGDHDVYDCAFLKQEGHLKKFLPYMTSIVQFGRYGVASTHMPDISGSEIYRLKQAYPILRAYIYLGESYVHGLPMTQRDKTCVEPCDITKAKAEEDINKPCETKKPETKVKCEDIGEPKATDCSNYSSC